MDVLSSPTFASILGWLMNLTVISQRTSWQISISPKPEFFRWFWRGGCPDPKPPWKRWPLGAKFDLSGPSQGSEGPLRFPMFDEIKGESATRYIPENCPKWWFRSWGGMLWDEPKIVRRWFGRCDSHLKIDIFWWKGSMAWSELSKRWIRINPDEWQWRHAILSRWLYVEKDFPITKRLLKGQRMWYQWYQWYQWYHLGRTYSFINAP